MKQKLLIIFAMIFSVLGLVYTNVILADNDTYKVVLNVTNLYSDNNFGKYWGTDSISNVSIEVPVPAGLSNTSSKYPIFFYGNNKQQVELYVLIYKRHLNGPYELVPVPSSPNDKANAGTYDQISPESFIFAASDKTYTIDPTSVTIENSVTTTVTTSSIKTVNNDNNYMRDVCKYYPGDIVSGENKTPPRAGVINYFSCHADNGGKQGIKLPYDSLLNGQSRPAVNKYYLRGCFVNDPANKTTYGCGGAVKGAVYVANFQGAWSESFGFYTLQVKINIMGTSYSSNIINFAPIQPGELDTERASDRTANYHQLITNNLTNSFSLPGAGIDDAKLAPNIAEKIDYAQHVGILDVYPPLKKGSFKAAVNGKSSVVVYPASSPNSGIIMYGVSAFCPHDAANIPTDGPEKGKPTTYVKNIDCFGADSGTEGIFFANAIDVYGNRLTGGAGGNQYINIFHNWDGSLVSWSNF